MKTREELRRYQREYYLKNREKILVRCVEWQLANREINAVKRIEYRQRNRELLEQRAIQRWLLKGEEIKARKRAAYDPIKARIQREKYKDQKRAYYQANREKWNARERQRMETDENFKLKKILRGRICVAIRKIRGHKKGRTVELLGCTIEFARGFIEARFKPGMTWGNHGEWHIDHIVPCAEFDLRDPEQQRACFHYSNLQPLWAADNIRKGCRKLGSQNSGGLDKVIS